MPPPKPSWLKILLAALPALALTGHFSDAWRVGVVVCSIYWAVSVFFKLTWSFFPRRVIGFSMVLLLIFLGSLLWALTDMAPYWLASVYLLGPLEFGGKREMKKVPADGNISKIISHRFPKIFWQGAGFFVLMVILGGAQTFLSARVSVSLFQSPAGVLLLLGILAALCVYRLPLKKAEEGE